MNPAAYAVNIIVPVPDFWVSDWAWGLPMIVLTLLIHVLGLSLISEKIKRVEGAVGKDSRYSSIFVTIIGTTVLLAILLHGVEGLIWAVAYRMVGATPTYHSAILYSLSAITSYGHAQLLLEERWQLMGALEALNGCLLFGITTAFLFSIMQQTWELQHKRQH